MKFLSKAFAIMLDILIYCGAVHAEDKNPEDFAKSMMMNQFDASSAEAIIPLTKESENDPELTNKNRRRLRARSAGPVKDFTNVACSLRPATNPDRCDGQFYMCHVQGDIRTGPIKARLAICYSGQKHWQLSAVMMDFQEPDVPSSPDH